MEEHQQIKFNQLCLFLWSKIFGLGKITSCEKPIPPFVFEYELVYQIINKHTINFITFFTVVEVLSCDWFITKSELGGDISESMLH